MTGISEISIGDYIKQFVIIYLMYKQIKQVGIGIFTLGIMPPVVLAYAGYNLYKNSCPHCVKIPLKKVIATSLTAYLLSQYACDSTIEFEKNKLVKSSFYSELKN